MRFAAFVRAVMVGREGLHRATLVEAFERGGASAVSSHLATGNVTFTAETTAIASIEATASARISQIVGRETEVFIRSQVEIEELLDADPFAARPYAEPRDWIVTFFESPLTKLQLPSSPRVATCRSSRCADVRCSP